MLRFAGSQCTFEGTHTQVKGRILKPRIPKQGNRIEHISVFIAQ